VNRVFYGLNKKGDVKGNELTTAVMRSAHTARSESISSVDGEHVTQQLVLEYHCSAYNTLAAVIIRTQTKEAFFTTFFFKENPEKNERIWSNIVDLDKIHKLEVEALFPKAHKSIREISDLRKQASSGSAHDTGGAGYLPSQYFNDATMSQDHGALISSTPVTSATGGNTPGSSIITSSSPTIQDEDLELDSVNQNPCMTTLLRVIDHMQTKLSDAPPPPAPGDGTGSKDKEMPKWMASIYSKLTSSDVHPNISLFLVKVILNRPKLFQPYSFMWLRPLLEFMLSAFLTQGGINYFLRDLCSLIISWEVVPSTPTEEKLSSQLLNHLIKNVVFPKTQVVHVHIILITLLVAQWKGRFLIDKKPILQMISCDPDHKYAKVYRGAGLQLLGVLLANLLPAFDPNYDTTSGSEFHFYDCLLSNLLFSSKDVYSAAAEVCGLVLWRREQVISEGKRNEPELERSFELPLKTRINGMFVKGDTARALSCLVKIGKHFRNFIDGFFLRIFDVLPSLPPGELKGMTLQLIEWRNSSIENLFAKLTPVMNRFLAHRDEEPQERMLNILLDILKIGATPAQIGTIADSVLANSLSLTSSECRKAFLDIAIWLYENQASLRDHEPLRLQLLKALSDENEEISKRAFEFWDSPERLSEDTFKRLNNVLEVTLKLTYPLFSY
jgi:DNA-dependent protein kinase catalytic subunit